MKQSERILIAAAAGLGIFSGAAQAAAAKGPTAVIRQSMDAFNRGDMAAFKASFGPAPAIIDEIAPHAWSGPGSLDAWLKDLNADMTKNGETDGKVVLGKATRSQIDGDTAYVVIRSTFAYTQKGAAMAEPASMTFAMRKGKGGWKTAGFSWNGGTPHAVAAKAAAAPAAKPAAPKH